jgi:aryl-alcohol dehydrogenase-like predicted oxidoreductase
VEFRYLGNSGLKISEITYGNWLTHGSQVENDQATACVRAALDAGISTFDTADAYANTMAETVLGEALKSERRESLEILTKVYWPVGPGGHNDVGLSRKHIMESINGSLSRLQTDYVDLYQAHRFDYDTPLDETMQAFADVVRMGKALYIGVSEWTAQQIQDGHDLAEELGIHLIANQPQYSSGRGRRRTGLRLTRHLADRLLTNRPGCAHGKVPSRRAAADRLAGDRREGWRRHDQAVDAG